MKGSSLAVWAVMLIGAVGAVAATADSRFSVIAEKNAFRLNPPPPPATNAPPAPEKEKTNLRFTGLSWQGQAVSAWLVIDSLEPGGTATYLSLAPGEKASGVEVVGIDEANQKVKLNYRSKPLDLAMETASSGPTAPGGRPIPGVPNVPRVNPPTAAIPGVNLNRSPVANPSGGSTRSFNGVSPTIPSPPINPSADSYQRQIRSRSASGGYGAGAVANPSPLANPVNNGTQNARPFTAEESAVAVEVQRAIQPSTFPPLPPTQLSH